MAVPSDTLDIITVGKYSDQRKKHSRVSISDDSAQQTFTVTMTSISATDAGSYWCCIELSGPDVKQHLELQVTEGAPDLYVKNQTVTASEGSSVLISCFHQNQKPKRWCKLRGECGKESMHGATVELIDSDKCLKVNISNLRMEHTGWYFCAVGDLQMPVYISVTTKLPAQTTALNQPR
ncbi:uncharacterized protein LOC118813008 [Colossoma macropomum]|uniref:uncharacterized protein LOC118813008 n=1 Tax=Colossoma macropomum TaxID=42526 RepID=UPI00186470B8|nr:uncharacterized protein LOC118813008 [Colossoma macropomum]